MHDALLPDGLADALGAVIAGANGEWRKDLDRIGAEARAVVAEFREKMFGFEAKIASALDAQVRRVDEALAKVKDGAPGEQGPPGPKGDAGEKGELGEKGDEGGQGPAGEKGEPGDAGARGEAGPVGEAGEKGAAGEQGPEGRSGKDAHPEAIAALVAAEVARAISGLELPKGDKGDPGECGHPGERGLDGLTGKDGVGLAGALIDRAGNLIVTLADGTARVLGAIVGKDGAPGDGGKDGRDGVDGVGFDDLDLVETERGVMLRFTRGEAVKEFRLPIVVDRGVYSDQRAYGPGDGVTFGGSFWIAQTDTSEKPEGGKGWRLAVKRGRDGKDGVMKEAPKPGPVRVMPPDRP